MVHISVSAAEAKEFMADFEEDFPQWAQEIRDQIAEYLPDDLSETI